MRSVVAKVCGFGVAIVSGYLLYFSVVISSLPLDSGETRWWIPVLKSVLYAPTLWVTKPIHQALFLAGHYAIIPWLTFAEIGLLAILYGVLVHQAILGKLAPNKIAAWFGRRKWAVAAVAAVMIVGSVAGRVATAQQDFRKEVSADESAIGVVPVAEPLKLEMSVVNTTTVAFPDGVEVVAAMQNRGQPVTILVTGNVQRDETDFMSSTADLTMFELAGEGWKVAKKFGGVRMPPFGTDFRSPGDPSAPGVVFLNLDPRNPQLMAPFDDDIRFLSFPPYIDSQAGFLVDNQVWVVGLGFGWDNSTDPSIDRISAYDHPNFATHSLGVFRLDTETGKVELKGVCDKFTDHSIDTLDATLDQTGVLHIAAAEVLIANENSLRIHYLRFDTTTSKWLGDEVRWASDVFTSTVDTLVRRSSQGVEMIWNLSRSPEVESGGVFACSSGDAQVFQLSDHEDSFLGAIADPFPGIDLLVGRVDPGFQSDRTPGLSQQERLMKSFEANRKASETEERTVDWYVNKDGAWFNAGTTTVPSRLYDPGFGQTGFWIWPGEDGNLVAAFRAQHSMIVQKIALK